MTALNWAGRAMNALQANVESCMAVGETSVGKCASDRL